MGGVLAGGPLTGCAPSDPGAEAEELQVQDTDYTTFALMVSRRQSGSQSILRVYLLCEPSSASLQPSRAWAGKAPGPRPRRVGGGACRSAAPCCPSQRATVFFASRQNVGD